MNIKYKKRLIIIGILLLVSFIITMTYFIWKMDSKKEEVILTYENCVEIVYSDEEEFDLINPSSISDYDGPRTIAKSVMVNNKCSTTQTVSVLLNVKKESTLEESKIKIYLNGDFNVESTLLSNVKNLKNTDENISSKKLLYKEDIEAGAIKRFNIRMWLDEDATTTQESNSFYTTYTVLAQDQVIKPLLKEKILEDNGGLSVVNNNTIEDYSSVSTLSGLYKVEDHYYFRGNPTNNYFKLNDLLFRVVSINSDGSIELGYVNSELQTKYNESSNKEESLYFKDSTIYKYLNEWYTNHLSTMDNYILSSNYCNDLSYTKNYNKKIYGGTTRVFESYSPTSTCPTEDTEVNNKVGTLTVDEYAIIGNTVNENNSNTYIYNGLDQYTISPYEYYYGAYISILNKEGKITYTKPTKELNVTPVIVLNGSLYVKGSGTLEDAYELDLED